MNVEQMNNMLDDQYLRCPITKKIFKNPVIATDYKIYEEQAIIKWMIYSKHSPTGIWISKQFVFDKNMYQRVTNYLLANPDKTTEQYILSRDHIDNKKEINFLIKKGNYCDLLNYTNFDLAEWMNVNELLNIIKLSSDSVLTHLISNCLDINCVDIQGYSLIHHMICLNAKPNIIKFIIDLGAKLKKIKMACI